MCKAIQNVTDNIMLLPCYILQCWVLNYMSRPIGHSLNLLYLPKIHKLKLWYLGRH